MAFATIEGIRTHYQVAGKGPPLLLLVPVGDHASIPQRRLDRVWRGFKPTEQLTRDFQLITYDRRESGHSGGRIEPLSWTAFARHADALLEHLGIEQAFLLGGCVGSSVALALGAHSPDRCRALLLHWPVGGLRWLNRGRANFDRHIAFVREHGLLRVAELAGKSGMFWGNPEAGPWSSVIASDESFAQSFVRQDLDRYLEVVAQSRDNLFSDTMPSGVTSSQLMTMRIPAFIMPGDDALHTTSCAHVLRELMPHAKLSRLMPRQQNAASIERWIYESAAACDYARSTAFAA
ncbi:MAG: alpha/beta hydrolase fold [Proteobacteria bacterium]|nr:alpha/beta hydrolase fold [Pseudomonadota bacterium]